MQFLNAINIVALLFYSQKKEEEKLSLKKMRRGVIQKVVTDRQKTNLIGSFDSQFNSLKTYLAK